MNIALAFNTKTSAPNLDVEKQVDLEFDSPEVTEAQKKALEDLGHTVYLVNADENAFNTIKELKGKIDIVFNVAEGLNGDARESQIPIFCEILGIPYTHSSPTTHAVTINKEFTKLLLKGANAVKVPGSFVVQKEDFTIPSDMHFPLIVKPNKEGSSKGVMDKNVVNNEEELKDRVKITSENYKKEVLVEEFINGREFTVAVIGNEDRKVLPIVEQKFDFLPSGMNKIASFELKWVYEDSLKDLKDAYDCPANLTSEERDEIVQASKRICDVLDIKDCARIDFRMNPSGELYFIEINSLPGMIPDENVISYLPLAARTSGMGYKELIGTILDLAVKRYKIQA